MYFSETESASITEYEGKNPIAATINTYRNVGLKWLSYAEPQASKSRSRLVYFFFSICEILRAITYGEKGGEHVRLS